MQIAQLLSGYSLGEADLLRRAMGKKIKAEMDAQRDRFVTGAVERDLTPEAANTIFDLLAKFADYGFNKSHAAAYALIAYQTAYLKANHPVEFLAASMTFDKANTDKLAEFRNEARRLGIEVLPPSINRSAVDFEVTPDQPAAIVYALSAIKGAGEGQVASLVRSRGTRPFASLADVALRLDIREVNKKVLESLAAAGAFDGLEPDRARVVAGLEPMVAMAAHAEEERRAGQSALFGTLDVASAFRVSATTPWTAAERLRREFDAVGFFLSGHPLDAYEAILKRLRVRRWAEFARAVKDGESSARLAVSVLDRSERRTRSGSKIGIVTLSDPTGQFEAIMFQETLNHHRDLFEKGAAVLITVLASADGDEVRVRIVQAESLDAAAHRTQRGLRIHVRDAIPLPAIASRLDRRGDAKVSIVIEAEGDGPIEVELPGRFGLGPGTAGALRATAGVLAVEAV